MELTHYDIHVIGRVQGVRFRQSAMEMAISLGLNGHAMNLADGSVSIVAEGHREDLEHLLAWCRIGPPLALVREVTVKEGPCEQYQCFHVER
ncbi:MAG: acylphosphatase [Flavobacteriales bacterium]|nr:acylphosphatase [Flavobacteriales bacterium]